MIHIIEKPKAYTRNVLKFRISYNSTILYHVAMNCYKHVLYTFSIKVFLLIRRNATLEHAICLKKEPQPF